MPQYEVPGCFGFGTELRRIRTEQCLSLSALARLIHYSKGYLSKIENGEKPPTWDVAIRCDDTLGARGALTQLLPVEARQVRDRPGVVRPRQLPASVPDFTGRQRDLDELEAHFTRGASVIVISGPPGVGKTSLALNWGRRLRDRFHDGTLYIDLCGYGPTGTPLEPLDVLDDFLRALGAHPGMIPHRLDARAAMYRTCLEDQRLLVVLDNAVSSEQVRPLLPGSLGCLVVVTSRRWLSGLVAREGARRVSLNPFSPAEAVTLLRRTLGGERVDGELAALQELARHCAYLPLALRVTAERVLSRPHLCLADLAADLAEERNKLDLLSAEGDELSSVRPVFSWSYRALRPETAQVFRVLGLQPGLTFSLEAAVALTGMTTERLCGFLELLVHDHLLEEVGRERYRFHDLLRAYAIERVTLEENARTREDALRRVSAWYLLSADSAGRAIGPDRGRSRVDLSQIQGESAHFDNDSAAVAWCETECVNLVAVARMALSISEPTVACGIPLVLWNFFYLRKPWGPWVDALMAGLDAARMADDPLAEAWILNDLATTSLDLRRFDEAFDRLAQVRALRQGREDPWATAWTDTTQGFTYQAAGHQEQAFACHQRAHQFYRSIGDEWGEALAGACLGDIARNLGRLAESMVFLREAQAVFRRLGDRFAEGFTLERLAVTMSEAGEAGPALDTLGLALHGKRQSGARRSEATTLVQLGALLSGVGQQNDARERLKEALVILEELGDPSMEEVRAVLRTLDSDEDP